MTCCIFIMKSKATANDLVHLVGLIVLLWLGYLLFLACIDHAFLLRHVAATTSLSASRLTDKLTSREVEVLRLLAAGLNNAVAGNKVTFSQSGGQSGAVQQKRPLARILNGWELARVGTAVGPMLVEQQGVVAKVGQAAGTGIERSQKRQGPLEELRCLLPCSCRLRI